MASVNLNPVGAIPVHGKAAMIENVDPVEELRQACADAGSMARWADFHGITESYPCRVLRGEIGPGPAILDALGLERVVTYRRVPKPQAVQDLEARFPERVKRSTVHE